MAPVGSRRYNGPPATTTTAAGAVAVSASSTCSSSSSVSPRKLTAVLLFLGCLQHDVTLVSAFAPPPLAAMSNLRRASSVVAAAESCAVPRDVEYSALLATRQQSLPSINLTTARQSTRRRSTRLHAEEGGGDKETQGEGWTSEESDDASSADGERAMGVGLDGGGKIPLPEIDVVNPFKVALDAGRNLRASFSNTLEQITGTASPVSVFHVGVWV